MISLVYIYTYGSVPWEEMYKDDPRVWHAIFEMICQHFSDLEKTGIDLGEPNGRVYPIILGNKGDWSYLVPGLQLMMSMFVCTLGCPLHIDNLILILDHVRVNIPSKPIPCACR